MINKLLYDDVLIKIFNLFNHNERYHLKLVCKKWNTILNKCSTGKLIIFEYRQSISNGKLKLKDDYWSIGDCLQVNNIDKLFRNSYFLFNFKLINCLIVFGNEHIIKLKNCNLKLEFQNLTYLELYNCHYDNLDKLKSDKLIYLFIDSPCTNYNLFTNFNSLQYCDLFFDDTLDKYFNQKFASKLKVLKTENYLNSKDVNRLIRYCPKLEQLNCKLEFIDLLYRLVNRLYNLKLIKFYTADCSLDRDQRNKFKNFISTKIDQLNVYYAGFGPIDLIRIELLFKFLDVNKYHNWSIIETERLNEIQIHYLNDLDYLDDYLRRMTRQIRLFNNFKLDNCLLIKFKNLKKILLSKCTSINFNNLIIHLPNLVSITLNSCSINKNDYYLIPNYCHQITDLIINTTKLIDFNFIFQINNLQQLALLIDRSISLDNYFKIIEQCKYLIIFRANINYLIEESDILFKQIKLNQSIRNKIIRSPNINYKFVILDSKFENSIEINSSNLLV